MNAKIQFCVNVSIMGLLLTSFNCSNSPKIASRDELPSDVDKYEFLSYSGGQEVVSPDCVVHADNNWEILIACLGGKTWQDLKEAGVHATESQLLLLRAMRFIDYKDDWDKDTLTTTLPILGQRQKQLSKYQLIQQRQKN